MRPIQNPHEPKATDGVKSKIQNPKILRGRILVAGEAQGEALVSREPLSFWGGYDQHTGEIIDRRHPLLGAMAAGRILAVPPRGGRARPRRCCSKPSGSATPPPRC